MPSKVIVAIFGLIFLSNFSALQAQEKNISVGAFLDYSVESPSYTNIAGVQGKYDFSDRQALQLQVGFGNYDIFAFGADYLYTVLPLNRMLSVFVGAGIGYEGQRNTNNNDIILNAQAGLQFDIKRFSPYIGFKPKFYFEAEGIDATTIMLGVRFRL